MCCQFSCTNSFYLQTFLPDDLFPSRASNQSIRYISGGVVPPVERCRITSNTCVTPDWVLAVLLRKMEQNWGPDLEDFVQDVVVPSCPTVNSSGEMERVDRHHLRLTGLRGRRVTRKSIQGASGHPAVLQPVSVYSLVVSPATIQKSQLLFHCGYIISVILCDYSPHQGDDCWVVLKLQKQQH